MKSKVMLVLIVVCVVIGSTYWLVNPSGQSETALLGRYESNHQDGHQPHASASGDNLVSRSISQYIQPIEPVRNINMDKVRIGWQLFNDPNLSSNQQISCASCHDLATNGAELTSVSKGVHGLGSRNSLTVFNVDNNIRFFWDGRSNSLHDQLDGPVHNPLEMDSNWPEIVSYISNSPTYMPSFKALGLEMDEETVKSLIVEFQQTLATPNSPFDQFLRGDDSAMEPAAKRGWMLFQQEGCIRCHQGTNIGGGMVMKFGFFGENKTGQERSEDKGRFEATSDINDVNLFRVASLRNVAITPPYFHDGRTSSLNEAIQIMAESQLGKQLDRKELNDIESFLSALTGERPSILEELESE